MFRFIHSSDLHLGKRFGNLPEDLRGRLREARHMAIGRLAEAARNSGAGTILLAGDTFDAETPTPSVLRQALAEMRGHAPLRFVILPGNHDSLLADELWSSVRGALPDNVLLVGEAAPVALEPAVILLPAPCTARRPGRDLTDWMDRAATPEGALRIGLAHGPVQSFSEDDAANDVIAPDRPGRARLDYLALGDWHGQMRIGDRLWYSGTPEPDRFKHGKPGSALRVAIEGPGAVPLVEPVETGSFDWRMAELALLSGEDAVARLGDYLPAGPLRRQTLLQIAVSGRTRIAGRLALAEAFEAVAPEFAHAALDLDGLASDCESDDLGRIDRAGALRQAAETLLAESGDEKRTEEEREVARAALIRLFSYCEAIEA